MTDDKSRILLVDDTPDNISVLMGTLKDRYAILVARGGEEALKLTAETTPDLILLDIMMPGMDGYEVCRRLKTDERLRDVPVIFISGLGETVDKIKAFTAGGVDYVTKPFQREEVLARVSTHLALRQQQLENERQKKQLQENLDRLHELEQLRDNLVHMVVHDMRSPLMGMLGYATMLQEDLASAGHPAFAADAAEIRLAGTMLRDMITNMLDISRLEAQQMPLNREVCDLQEIVLMAIKSLEGIAMGKSIRWTPPERPLNACCDADIARRVLENLIANALKFTSEGGEVRLAASAVEGGVKVLVTDTGPGIPAEYQKSIFDRFVQAKAKTQGKTYSTGLGLTFCKLAAEAHGGAIGLESEVGKGSTFWVCFPASAGQHPESE